MKQLSALSLSLFLFILATSCKKDDDNDWDPPRTGDYFTCLVNGERLETSSSSNCSGETFYYYPPGAVQGIDSSYILLRGIDCDANSGPVVIIGFLGVEPFTGYLDFLNPEQGDTCAPVVLGNNLITYDRLIDGWMDVEEFSPRQPNNGDFGTFKGTFGFTVTHDTIETVYEVTDGEFRFAVPNSW
jgi:hypothetical protein